MNESCPSSGPSITPKNGLVSGVPTSPMSDDDVDINFFDLDGVGGST